MLANLQILFFVSAGMILISTVNAKSNCSYVEPLPGDFPCYSDVYVYGWLKALQVAGCSSSMTKLTLPIFFNLIKTFNPNYVKIVDVHLMRTPLQCGEKLVNNSALTSDPSQEASMFLYCQTFPALFDEIEPSSNAFKLMSCAMHEYARKFETKTQEFKLFKAMDNVGSVVKNIGNQFNLWG